MILFDWVLILIAVLCAAMGYGQRLTVTLGWLLGFIAGVVLGRFAGIWLFTQITGDESVSTTASATIPLVAGIIISIVGSWIGALLREAISSRVGRSLDALGGALAALLAFTMVVWIGAGWVRTSSLVSLNSWVAESRLVAGIDKAAPVDSSAALGEINAALAKNGFPQVFSGQPERIRSVGAPNKNMASVGHKVQESTVKVVTDRTRCGNISEGTGWVYRSGYVATNAHVVAGSNHPSVQSSGAGRPYRSTVVAFNPKKDIAVLRVEGLSVPALGRGATLRANSDSVVVGYPGNGPYTISPARVREHLNARGLDIYGQDTVIRQIYSLRAIVRPGNSGGPLVDADGRVSGMVFAKSASDEDTGYALTRGEIDGTLDRAAGRTAAVSTGDCAAE